MIKSNKHSSCKNQDLWITSYADLVSAILAVLVLMVSFSKIDIEKYDMIQRLMVQQKQKTFDNFSTLQEIKKRIEDIAIQNKIQDKIAVSLDDRGLIVNFDSAAQFDVAKYVLKEQSSAVMLPVFNEIVAQSQYRYIDIAGYTDDVPGYSMSNWELSSLRALAIQKKLESLGLKNKNVRLLANADNDPLEKYGNKTGAELESARAKNRRVSIVIRDAIFDDLNFTKTVDKR